MDIFEDVDVGMLHTHTQSITTNQVEAGGAQGEPLSRLPRRP